MKTILIYFCSFAFAFSLAAKERNQGSAQHLDELVIVADKSDSGELDIADLPNFVSVVEIGRAQARNISVEELLEKETSVQIRKFGGVGSSSSITIRGSAPNQVKIFIDGIPVSEARSGSADLSTLSIDEFAAIEIYRGSAPAKFGTVPIGGVVNLVSKKEPGDHKFNLKSSFGSYGTWKAAFDGHISGKKWHALLSTSLLESQGDYDYIDDLRTINDTSDDVERTRQNNEVSQQHLFSKFLFDLNETTRMHLSHSYLHKDQGLPGRANQQTQEVNYEQDKHFTQIGFDFETFSIALSRQHRNERFRDTFGASGELGLGKQDNENKHEQLAIKMSHERWWGPHFLEFNWLMLKESYRPFDNQLNAQYPSSQRLTNELSIQDTIGFQDDKFILVPSLSYQLTQNRLRAEQAGQNNFSNENNDNDLTYQLGATWTPKNFLKIKGNVASAIRQPNFVELFGDRGVTVGNNDLLLEESLGFDLGVHAHFLKDREFLSNLELSAAYFDQSRKNLIQFIFDARGVGHAVNIAKGEVSGFEITQQVDFWLGFFNFKQQLTLIDTQITDSTFPLDIGKQIPGIYEKTYSATLTWKYRKFRVHGELFAQDNMFYDKTNLIQAANKNVYNLGIGYTHDKWQLFLDAKNLTDDRIEDFNGWPLPGRTFLFTATYRFF